MVADALIYHPAVTHFNNYVATTVGRDKFLRTIQYFSRFLSYYTYRQNYSQQTVDTFTKLKSNLGLVRKAMRLGKFVEHLRAAALAADSKSLDPVLKFCAVGRQLGYAGYLFADMLTYLDAAGVRKSEAAKRLQAQAYKAWALGLSFSVVSGVYSLYQMREQGRRVVEMQGTDAEKKLEGKKILRTRAQAQKQLLSDFCDLTVPTSALGYVDLDDGLVGLAGTVSSLLGLQTQWQKTAPPS
ncbi:putative peroxisomal membrane protein PMP27 [Myriangium duriaei CBS 260.36]|uniref:Peroxisomal membrane protein PMP27 n=1 Tax=Myriangium duriaei CBS 260.36 TaxID=1168546 RepID=A0A9P4MGU9_9PEZI|nr:putative peroxisomal membrane protein PMP27 [Myriangium duriaei CBS 260.36]